MKYIELFGKTFYVNTVLPDNYHTSCKEIQKMFPGYWVVGIADSKLFLGLENVVIEREIIPYLGDVVFPGLLLSIVYMVWWNCWLWW